MVANLARHPWAAPVYTSFFVFQQPLSRNKETRKYSYTVSIRWQQTTTTTLAKSLQAATPGLSCKMKTKGSWQSPATTTTDDGSTKPGESVYWYSAPPPHPPGPADWLYGLIRGCGGGGLWLRGCRKNVQIISWYPFWEIRVRSLAASRRRRSAEGKVYNFVNCKSCKSYQSFLIYCHVS